MWVVQVDQEENCAMQNLMTICIKQQWVQTDCMRSLGAPTSSSLCSSVLLFTTVWTKTVRTHYESEFIVSVVLKAAVRWRRQAFFFFYWFPTFIPFILNHREQQIKMFLFRASKKINKASTLHHCMVSSEIEFIDGACVDLNGSLRVWVVSSVNSRCTEQLLLPAEEKKQEVTWRSVADWVWQLRIRKEEPVVESFSVQTNTPHRAAQKPNDESQKEEVKTQGQKHKCNKMKSKSITQKCVRGFCHLARL